MPRPRTQEHKIDSGVTEDAQVGAAIIMLGIVLYLFIMLFGISSGAVAGNALRQTVSPN